MARLFDRFDPDREKWSSYLMRAEFYFDSNNITTEQKKKAALCSTMSPETCALLQNLLTREVTDVSYEEVKAALQQHFEEKRNFLAARLDFFRTCQCMARSRWPMAAHSHWLRRTVSRWHVVGRDGCVLEMATRSEIKQTIQHLRLRLHSMTCLRSSGAVLRRSYRTMVHSSPQRSLLTGAMHTRFHV